MTEFHSLLTIYIAKSIPYSYEGAESWKAQALLTLLQLFPLKFWIPFFMAGEPGLRQWHGAGSSPSHLVVACCTHLY